MHLQTSPAVPIGLGDPLCSRSPHTLRFPTLPGGDRPHRPGTLQTCWPGARRFSQGPGPVRLSPSSLPCRGPCCPASCARSVHTTQLCWCQEPPCAPRGLPLPRNTKGGDSPQLEEKPRRSKKQGPVSDTA